MRWELWLAFVGASVAISLSPGAGAVQSMATGVTHGLRRGLWSVAGLQIGLMAQLVVVAVGVGAAVSRSLVAFTVIKWIGVLYLVYLAVRQWRATPQPTAAVDTPADGGRAALLLRGALVNITNPKGLVFLLAVLPQFVVPTQPLLAQYLAIAATMVVVDVVVMGAYTGLAVKMLGVLNTAGRQRALNRAMSILFAAAAAALALVRRGATT